MRGFQSWRSKSAKGNGRGNRPSISVLSIMSPCDAWNANAGNRGYRCFVQLNNEASECHRPQSSTIYHPPHAGGGSDLRSRRDPCDAVNHFLEPRRDQLPRVRNRRTGLTHKRPTFEALRSTLVQIGPGLLSPSNYSITCFCFISFPQLFSLLHNTPVLLLNAKPECLEGRISLDQVG